MMFTYSERFCAQPALLRACSLEVVLGKFTQNLSLYKTILSGRKPPLFYVLFFLRNQVVRKGSEYYTADHISHGG